MRWSNATPIRRSDGMGYMCCYCDNQFKKPADLKKHTIDTHPDVRRAYFINKLTIDRFVVRLDITLLRCKICDQNLDTLEQLIQHLKNDHQKKIYTDVKNHITPLKFLSETLRCCICMNTFQKFKMLLEHMHSHYRNYICNICDSGFINSLTYTNHMLTHSNGAFKCDFCPLVFETKNKQRLHARKHSKISMIFRCGYCSETFSSYRQRENHLALAHGQAQKCQACNRDFKNARALTDHVKRNHLMEKTRQCPECDMSFFSKKELNSHMVKHTGLRSYKCTVCSKCFGRPYTLSEHMKIHNNVRRFKCEHCGQAFVQKCSWRGHMRSKHGEIV